ncbi:MAG: PIG-L family deacetylase [Vicinamibacterales bacterium]
MHPRPLLALSGAVLAGLLLAPASGQVRPVYDLGAAGLTQVLQRLQTTASALHTGAHPDDEDSGFIARTARGDHARVAYLALNRGEGGQNLIGTELFDALGVIRTEELLQARRLDGGQQFFTRTFDYGFSKSRREAGALWSEPDVLGDMVRVIRQFRPLVIYSRFSGTPADGHGHHEFAGYLTPIAFRAAADPAQYPEQIAQGLRPWQARKLYRGTGFRPDPANPPTVDVEIGALDPVIGRTFGEISLEGRSQHKSQEMGSVEMRGPMTAGLIRISPPAAPDTREAGIFDGLDVSVPGLAGLAGLPPGVIDRELLAMQTAAAKALTGYDILRPGAILGDLADGLRATRAARMTLRTTTAGTADSRAEADFLLAFKEADFSEALVRAAEVVVDPLASDETVVQGEDVGVAVRTFQSARSVARVTGASVETPAGWSVQASTDPGAAGPGPGRGGRREMPAHEAFFRVRVPPGAPVTTPYFLRTPRTGASYDWPTDAPRGQPFDAPALTGVVALDIAGAAVTVRVPVQYRFADAVRGELRRNVQVVPLVTVGLDSPLLIVPAGDTPHEQRLVVRVTSFAGTPVMGTLRLRLPDGWTASPADTPFQLPAKGSATAAPFVVTAPAGRARGSATIVAEAVVAGRAYTEDVQEVAYPHIQTHRLYRQARATAEVLDLQVAPVSVGYVMGSGDQVPDAIRRMGVPVTLLDDETLSTGDLARFDSIVVGVRASEARPAFVANNDRLLEYVRAGGTLIVQYQQGDYAGRRLTPLPAESMGNSRVTDETATVRILQPSHPVFTFPNQISTADFEGWVQERNLYALTGFDAAYVPLLESADPGEAAQRGGELYADVGRGRFVYTAYAWFRQLPAGVPGAYRQFANLISLPRAPRP